MGADAAHGWPACSAHIMHQTVSSQHCEEKVESALVKLHGFRCLLLSELNIEGQLAQ